MKTKYKHIEFVGAEDTWWCYTRKDDTQLGICDYGTVKKNTWEFVPFSRIGFSADCLRDIAHFLEQLNKEQPDG